MKASWHKGGRLRRFRSAGLLLVAAGLALAGPAAAHEKHRQERQELSTEAPEPILANSAAPQRTEATGQSADIESTRSLADQLVSWAGRIHPFAVHFPIGLFPVALLALILGRRKGHDLEVLRPVILVAALTLVVSAVLGWFTGGFLLVDSDWVHLWHRWTGTALGVTGAILALIVWRRRGILDQPRLLVVLCLITAALLLQGWLGAVLTHGIGHMAM